MALGALQAVSVLCGFGAVVLLADYFGADGLGEVSLALSLVGYGLVVGNLGTDLYAVKRVAARPSALGRLVSGVVRVRAAAAWTAFAVLAVVVWSVPEYRSSARLILMFGLSIPLVSVHLGWVPQALHRPLVFGAAQTATQVIYLALLWLVGASGGGLMAVAGARVAADVAVIVGLWAWMARARPDAASLRHSLPARGLLALARVASPIAGSQMVRSLALGSDLVILALLVDRQSLGHYSAAYRLFMVLLSLGTAYFVILLPRISMHSRRRGGGMLAEHRRSLLRLLPASAAGVALLALVAEPLLTFVFSSSFVAAAPALRLLGLAFLANIAGRHYRQILLARGRQVRDLRWSATAAGVHVAAKWVFGSLWGITGVALATLVGEVFLWMGLWIAAAPELVASSEPDVSAHTRGSMSVIEVDRELPT